MTEIKGNIWDYLQGNAIVVPTNGKVRSDGCCVMGRGIAEQCAKKHPEMPKVLGTSIKEGGNHVYQFIVPGARIFSFPVKHNWWETADILLIAKSALELVEITKGLVCKVYIPRVGCGNGNLQWPDVKSVLEGILTADRFVLVTL